MAKTAKQIENEKLGQARMREYIFGDKKAQFRIKMRQTKKKLRGWSIEDLIIKKRKEEARKAKASSY